MKGERILNTIIDLVIIIERAIKENRKKEKLWERKRTKDEGEWSVKGERKLNITIDLLLVTR